MPDDPYTLTDLARVADVTARTVRYYIAQGLLPSPEASGPATRYGEGHLARLRLIKRLQRDHLPLAEIRARMERMEDEEVQAALDATSLAEPEPPSGADATIAYVRALMTRAGVAPRFYDRPAEPPAGATFERRVPDEFPVRDAPGSSPLPLVLPGSIPAVLPSPAYPFPAPPALRSTTGDRSTWERMSITPDVELHVRRPLDRTTNKRVERLVRIARELFEEDA
jgi:DNA-binding transcriptional MerR regulator